MGEKYLLDTNVILDFMGKKLPEKSEFFLSEIIDDQINISAINKMELYTIIAATAIVNNFTLISRNFKDFLKITELHYINPYLPLS